jgi:hypothetical protein
VQLWGYRNERYEMNFELLMGIGLLVLGFGLIVFVAVARQHPLIYLSGLGVAAFGAVSVVAGIMPPGPARIGVQSFFFIVAFLAGFIQWRMARRLQRPPGRTPDQESGAR